MNAGIDEAVFNELSDTVIEIYKQIKTEK